VGLTLAGVGSKVLLEVSAEDAATRDKWVSEPSRCCLAATPQTGLLMLQMMVMVMLTMLMMIESLPWLRWSHCLNC